MTQCHKHLLGLCEKPLKGEALPLKCCIANRISVCVFGRLIFVWKQVFSILHLILASFFHIQWIYLDALTTVFRCLIVFILWALDTGTILFKESNNNLTAYYLYSITFPLQKGVQSLKGGGGGVYMQTFLWYVLQSCYQFSVSRNSLFKERWDSSECRSWKFKTILWNLVLNPDILVTLLLWLFFAALPQSWLREYIYTS